jgi:hypothetical protein
VRKGATGQWHGDHKQSTVWDIDKNLRSETGHGTQKPVECVAHAIEIAPAYVDVAVKRWQEFTGQQAVLETSTMSPPSGPGQTRAPPDEASWR